MRAAGKVRIGLGVMLFLAATNAAGAGEDWTQLKYDGRHSGNVPERSVTTPLGLVAAVPLSDAVFTAPVVAAGRVYVVDGAGVAWCLDAATLEVIWKFASAGGKANCNNVCSPAVAGRYLHFGTMAGSYYVLDAARGAVVKEIQCGDPIFSAPVVGEGRVYLATLGSRIYALEPDGEVCWVWDFVRRQLGFEGDRWSGQDWLRLRGRAGWQQQFCCNRNIALFGKTLVVPAGGTICWLEDTGEKAELRGTYLARREAPGTLGLSLGDDGTVYRQWTRRDNEGNVEVLRLHDGQVEADYVRGSETSYQGAGLLSFCSVSLRGRDVYRCRPQEGFGLCRHTPDGQSRPLGGYPSIAAPVLLKDSAVYGGLDGGLYIVPLSGDGEAWCFQTAFGKAVSAPVAVCDGRVYFGCEDGYLYVLGPDGKAPLPSKDLKLEKIRSPLGGKLTDSRNDWYTNFGNLANTNANPQGLRPPFKMKWIRRYEGTVKHLSVCGGGRMYTHTAEGQIFAVEQETGRLLWRRYFPGVHVSYTSPIYHRQRLLVPQAGLQKCRLRCLEAATGKLLWEAPFSGSPSWNRQLPPIPYKNLVIYQFSSGQYTPETWLFEHQSTFGFPKGQKPLVRAYDFDSGKVVWTRDFSDFGAGGDDAGMCLMDGTLYYSCYFGGKGPLGVTAAIEPQTGRILWTTTDYAVHAGCTVSGADGRLYLGGYNPVEGKLNRVWCLDAKDGSLVWKSEPVSRAIHVITIGERFLFTHSQYEHGYLIDKQTGKILTTLVPGYRCTRFTLSEPYLLGPNLTLFDLSRDGHQPEAGTERSLVRPAYCGPAVDVLLCVGLFASNGRLFYTTNGGGFQVSLTCGEEAASLSPPWEAK
jgi:outer membrane protein assembly factor BamB